MFQSLWFEGMTENAEVLPLCPGSSKGTRDLSAHGPTGQPTQFSFQDSLFKSRHVSIVIAKGDSTKNKSKSLDARKEDRMDRRWEKGRVTKLHFHAKKDLISPLTIALCISPGTKRPFSCGTASHKWSAFRASGFLRNPRFKGSSVGSLGWLSVSKAFHQPKHKQLKLKAGFAPTPPHPKSPRKSWPERHWQRQPTGVLLACSFLIIKSFSILYQGFGIIH